jgi:hypothetical protein
MLREAYPLPRVTITQDEPTNIAASGMQGVSDVPKTSIS